MRSRQLVKPTGAAEHRVQEEHERGRGAQRGRCLPGWLGIKIHRAEPGLGALGRGAYA